ncbi:MAG: hypothetical protein R3B84_23535 [Zavarzinella sp.]
MKWFRRAIMSLMAIVPIGAVGCGSLPLAFVAPGPVQPWVANRIEERNLHKNDHRAVIMPPIRDGFPPPLCEDPPTEREVLRTLKKVRRGVPGICEEFRDNIRIRCERIKDVIDPPRFFPLIGYAQLHHCHWKCIIYYTETIQSDYPFPIYNQKDRVEVIYIDKDHLHLYVGDDPELQKNITRELTEYAP